MHIQIARHHRRPAALLLSAALAATGVFTAAAQTAGAAAQSPPAAAAEPLNQAQVRQLLESRGYTDLDDIDFDDGLWQTEATSGNGKRVDIQVDPATGEIITDKAVSQVGENDIRARLTAAGYSKVHDVDFDDGMWKAKAKSPQGEKVELRLSPQDGAIVSVQND